MTSDSRPSLLPEQYNMGTAIGCSRLRFATKHIATTANKDTNTTHIFTHDLSCTYALLGGDNDWGYLLRFVLAIHDYLALEIMLVGISCVSQHYAPVQSLVDLRTLAQHNAFAIRL